MWVVRISRVVGMRLLVQNLWLLVQNLCVRKSVYVCVCERESMCVYVNTYFFMCVGCVYIHVYMRVYVNIAAAGVYGMSLTFPRR